MEDTRSDTEDDDFDIEDENSMKNGTGSAKDGLHNSGNSYANGNTVKMEKNGKDMNGEFKAAEDRLTKRNGNLNK